MQFLRRLAEYAGKLLWKSTLHIPGSSGINRPRAKVLTRRIARRYLSGDRTQKLSDYQSITKSAASLLASSTDTLDLDGITSLSARAARGLSRHAGWLSLKGLASISDAPVRELLSDRDRPPRRYICLDGLTTLSAVAEEAVLSSSAKVSLAGLRHVSDALAARLAIAKKDDDLELRVTELSDQAAQALASHEGGWLQLPNLTALTDSPGHVALANKLGTQYGRMAGWTDYELSLNGLTSLSHEAAAAIAQQREVLSLNGLTRLSDGAAKALSRYEGYELSLNGVFEISEAAAFALAGVLAELNMCGLTQLTGGEAHAALVRKLLSDGDCDLNRLQAISPSVAAAIVEETLPEQSIDLNGLTRLEDGVAEALARHPGVVSLLGVTQLTDAAAATLARSRCDFQFTTGGIPPSAAGILQQRRP